jgi:hypothetical protein
MAIVGVLMNLIHYIVLIFVNTEDKEKDIMIWVLIFFIIPGFILLLCLIIFLLCQFKTEYFKFYLNVLYCNYNITSKSIQESET